MPNHTDRAVSFPDSLILNSQCLAGVIERGSPSLPDLEVLLTALPPDVSPPARLVVRHVFMRVFGRFARALDVARDAASIQAFVAWSDADPSSEHWREDLFGLVAAWRTARTPAREYQEPVGATVAECRIQRAIETIDRRYTEPRLTLRDVAGAANLSVCEAARQLKRQTGRGFVAHLHQRRIAASRVHLTETILSVKEIADRVGYSSASEFGRHFKRSSAMTPREYRRARVRMRVTSSTKSHDE